MPWRRMIRFIDTIFFKESMIDRVKHLCHVEFCKMTELYVSSHKARVIQSPISENRIGSTVLLLVRGPVGLGIQELLYDTWVD